MTRHERRRGPACDVGLTRGEFEAGMVTAETAAVLPVLALVLSLALWAVSAAAAEVRCSDAAREGARAAARGDPDNDVRTMALRAAPGGSSVTIARLGGDVRVTVGTTVRWLGRARVAVDVTGEAVAALEPTGLDAPTAMAEGRR